MKRNLFILLLTVGTWVPAFGGQVFKEAIPYINAFVYFGHAYGIETTEAVSKLTVTFVNVLPGTVIGLCYTDKDNPIVFIRYDYWVQADLIHREQIIWHELGHCVLDRSHEEKMINSHPVSIMYPDNTVVEDERYYLKHRFNYIKELFTY